MVAGVASAIGTRWFREGGGMPTVSPVPLSGRYLLFAEREEIAILHAQRCGVREIARRIGRAPSTVSRELRRNASTRDYSVPYRATTAQWHADRRARRPKQSKLAANDALREYVQDRLAGMITAPDGEAVAGPQVRWIGRRHGRRQDRRWAKSWSPEQISNRLPVDFPDDGSMRISDEAIYQALYVQGRGALRRELVRSWIVMAISMTDAAERVLREQSRGAPMHYRKITELAIEHALIAPEGLTPEASLNAAITTPSSVRPIGRLSAAVGQLLTFYWFTRRKTVRATASATRPKAIAFNAASSGASRVAVDSGAWRPSR